MAQTNSWNGDYVPIRQEEVLYDMAYEDAPVYHDPPSLITGFGMQAWPMERVAELYYIFVKDGTKLENVQMAKSCITKWVNYALDYIFIGVLSCVR
ncbi:glycoside hydrolase family 48 protein [Bacillus sp. SL00103]